MIESMNSTPHGDEWLSTVKDTDLPHEYVKIETDSACTFKGNLDRNGCLVAGVPSSRVLDKQEDGSFKMAERIFDIIPLYDDREYEQFDPNLADYALVDTVMYRIIHHSDNIFELCLKGNDPSDSQTIIVPGETIDRWLVRKYESVVFSNENETTIHNLGNNRETLEAEIQDKTVRIHVKKAPAGNDRAVDTELVFDLVKFISWASHVTHSRTPGMNATVIGKPTDD